ncbi:MAG: queuosine precursor transporter [Termitinemataceae bacterium]|nr:MAG: queuosine precursor transporter [Termitinemataceae bacterium]
MTINSDKKQMTATVCGDRFRYLDIIMAAFVTVLILSNISSSAKIVDLKTSLFGIPLAFDGGTLLFPLSYIFGDVLTEVYGFKVSRKVIWTGFASLALSCLVFFLLKILPADAYWEEYAGSAAYESILGGMCSGGLWIASLSAYLAGEFSNSFLLAKIKIAMHGRLLFVRTIASTLVGELLDSFIFISIAVLLGVFSTELFWTLVITNYILKCLIEIIMTPLTYCAVNQLKKHEGIDVYG